MTKTTVKDLILILHNLPLDVEVRMKDKNGQIIPDAQLCIIEQESLGALFG